MYRKLFADEVSEVMEALTRIMEGLAADERVEAAVLSTEDGLSIQRISSQDTRLAAVAGFMQTAGQQAFTMMGLGTADEIIIRGGERHVLVCRSFYANRSKLILTMVCPQMMPYETIAAETISAIQQAMER